jgi:hypothetical protein
VTSVKFVLQWNAREVFRIAEYKPEKGWLDFTRHREMTVHSPAFEFQLNVRFTEMSLNNKIFFRWYNAVHVLVHEELRDILEFSIRENAEHCSHTTWSECNISGLAILLRGWNTASGSLEISGCTVSNCLLTVGWKSLGHYGQ